MSFIAPNLGGAPNYSELQRKVNELGNRVLAAAVEQVKFGEELRIPLTIEIDGTSQSLPPHSPAAIELKEGYQALPVVESARIYDPAPSHDGPDWCIFVVLRDLNA